MSKSELQERVAIPFLRVVADVLGQIAGKKASVELVETQSPPDLTVEIGLRSQPGVRLRVEFGEKESHFFARLLVGGPVLDASERRGTVEELWRQIVGRATTELRSVLNGGDLDVIPQDPQAWSPGMSFPARILLEGEETPVEIVLHMSENAAGFFVQTVTPVVIAAFGTASTKQQNLGLLLDVPLSVTLRFGERRMPLREILQLSSGAVIELDRRADEPVELLLDEKVIARGSVVVVDGCYGLRVTEVCNTTPARIRTGATA